MKFYVYKIYFSMNKKCYIGITYNIKKRMQEHLSSGSLVCKALYKYEDWQISILHICKSRDEANRIEIEEIRNFNSVAPNGYNLTRGGEGANYWEGKQRSKETKHKMSESHKGENNSMFGRKRPDVVKRNKENKYGLGIKNPKKGHPNNQNAKGNKWSENHRIKFQIAILKRNIKLEG